MSTTVFGFGPLERWLHDDDITEVMVNAGRHVWIERRPATGTVGAGVGGGGGRGRGTQYVGSLEPGVIDTVIERILTPIGRRLDRLTPVVDARLPDGARVCAVLAPVAVDGPCLAVRKFPRAPLALDSFGPPHVVELLHRVVDARCNVIVSGATSSGKTTLLNALAARVPAHERILTLEDTAELDLGSSHVLRLETRPATPDGVPAIDLRTLLRAALRLRPDRLVIGEIRGDEAADLVQALNTGHDGSLATMHANSAVEALARLESLVVQASPGWALAAIREQVERSVDVVVHVERQPDGRRAVHDVSEVIVDGGAQRLRTLASGGGSAPGTAIRLGRGR